MSAAGAGLFLLGYLQNNDQKRENGILSEKQPSGQMDTEVFKYAAGRTAFSGSTGRFVGGDSFLQPTPP
jgi:hypothetical protein